MDFRIGANGPVYGGRQTLRAGNRELKTSFAKMVAEAKAAGRDTVEISGNPLAKRLDSVHQKLGEMDFTGKSSEEVYKAVVDAYDDEFGFLGNLAYSDYDTYVEIQADKRNIFQEKVPGYERGKENELHYRAMGYDTMSKAEKIAAIKNRVGGSSYIHKYAMLDELEKANVITSHQGFTMFQSLHRKSKLEYCEAHGLDYMRFEYPSEYGDDYSERAMKLREKSLAAWSAKTDVTWLEIIESVKDYPAMHDWEKDAFFKEMAGVTELLVKGESRQEPSRQGGR